MTIVDVLYACLMIFIGFYGCVILSGVYLFKDQIPEESKKSIKTVRNVGFFMLIQFFIMLAFLNQQ